MMYIPFAIGLNAFIRYGEIVHSQANWPGCYIHVRQCGGQSMVLLQLKDPLYLFVKRKEFLKSQFRISITSRYDFKAVESDVKIPSFLLFEDDCQT